MEQDDLDDRNGDDEDDDTSVPHETMVISLDALAAAGEDDLVQELATVVDANPDADDYLVTLAPSDIEGIIESLEQAAETVEDDPSDYHHEAGDYEAAAAFWADLLDE